VYRTKFEVLFYMDVELGLSYLEDVGEWGAEGELELERAQVTHLLGAT
jgi:hypothetical protein